jgi:hypothetical protein
MKSALLRLARRMTARLWTHRSELSHFGETVLRTELDAARKQALAACTEADAVRVELNRSNARAEAAEQRCDGLKYYLADLPPTREEIEWGKDDARTLAAFLDGPTGEKLLRHMTNRLADYERAAVIYSNQHTAPLACKRAHGFRDARGELLRLSAAGPSPANHEPDGDALPPDLESLRA